MSVIDIKWLLMLLLEEKLLRKSERVKNESEEERNITLEEQRHCNLRHQQNVAQNLVQT